jgi:hypothetical protein
MSYDYATSWLPVGQQRIFNVDLAAKYGLNESIFILQLNHWLIKTKCIRIKGTPWHYDTVDAWQKQLPFFSKRTVERIISSLIKEKLIKVCQINKRKGDRTNWYTLNLKKLNEDCKKYMENAIKEAELEGAEVIDSVGF